MSEMMMPPQGGEGGMSPDIMALLGGAGAGGDAGMAPSGMAPPPEAAPAPEGGGDISDIIRQALDLVRQYAQQEASESGTLAAEKITSLLQQILADEEKELEDAMAGKASPKMLRSAYGA